MAGLYFHIPFCKRICSYCDFFRVAELSYLPSVVEAMHCELEEQREFLHDKRIETIYFGGGTPSLLSPKELQRLIDHASELFDCRDVGEITVEANPDDVSDEWAEQLAKTQINRVSLGVQSFDDGELKFMNRRHSAQEAAEAVRRVQRAGISNVTIDLIFGVDGYGDEVLENSIAQALELGVQHISAYHLTIEPNTAFGRRRERGLMREVDEEQSEKEFRLMHERLTAVGYEHYEVSNFALPTYRAKHNSSYWHGVEYLGIGAGAHSYNGEMRHYSEQSVVEYIKSREYVEEQLSDIDHFNEYVMTSLRCAEGISLDYLRERFGDPSADRVLRLAQGWIESEDLRFDAGRLFIPAERFMISDAVIESLFEV